MTSKAAGTIALFSIISLAALFFILWLVDFSQLGIPEFIPATKFGTYGTLILVSFILIFIFLQKRLLQLDKETSMWRLILASTIVSVISFSLYQIIRQLIILKGQYNYDLTSVLLSIIPAIIVSVCIGASVSFELKKVKGIWKYLPIAIILILYLLIKPYAHKFEW